MKNFILFLAIGISFSTWSQDFQHDSIMISAIYNEALSNGECYENLRVLCKDVGNRIAGSENAAKAIEWGVSTSLKYDFDSVFLMPVEVPHWVRGPKEIGFYTSNEQKVNFEIVALGGSVGSNNMITAKVIEVKSLDALDTIPEEKVRGKIVFFNKAMDPLLINTGAAYGGAYDIRSQGPSKAASKGAVACIIRSLTLADDKYAHTGATQYDESLPKIPAAALSSVDARALSSALKEDSDLEFSIHLQCQVFPRIIQSNVIAEIRGSEFPNEYIVVGGHLDSWDIGEGAHDDGTGVTQAIEVLRIMRALGYRPLHTIRAVLYMNEEFGNDGGKTYAEVVKAKNEKHIAAIESDGGGLTPQGFNVQGSDEALAQLQAWSPLFEPYQLFRFRAGWSGVDIGPLKSDETTLFGLVVDSQRYFDFHHSGNDIFENVNKREHTLGAAAMASLIYLLDTYK